MEFPVWMMFDGWKRWSLPRPWSILACGRSASCDNPHDRSPSIDSGLAQSASLLTSVNSNVRLPAKLCNEGGDIIWLNMAYRHRE